MSTTRVAGVVGSMASPDDDDESIGSMEQAPEDQVVRVVEDDDEEEGAVEHFGMAPKSRTPPRAPPSAAPEAAPKQRIAPPTLPVRGSAPSVDATDGSAAAAAGGDDVLDRAHGAPRLPNPSRAKQAAPALEGEEALLAEARAATAAAAARAPAEESDDEFDDILQGVSAPVGTEAAAASDGSGDEAGRRLVRSAEEAEAAREAARAAARAEAEVEASRVAREDVSAAQGGGEVSRAGDIVAEDDDLGGEFASGQQQPQLAGGAVVPMASDALDKDGGYDAAGESRRALAAVRGGIRSVRAEADEADKRAVEAEAKSAVEASRAAAKASKGALIEEEDEDEGEDEDGEEDEDEAVAAAMASPGDASSGAAAAATACPQPVASAADALEADFDQATKAYSAAQAKQAAAGHGVAAAVARAAMSITFREALPALRAAVAAQEEAGDWRLPDVPLELGAAPGWFCFPGPSLTAAMQRERRAIHRIAQTPFDDSNAIHRRIMAAVYTKLSGGDVTTPDWTEIGFQNPHQFQTDLRGGGMLGPLCLLYFVDRHPRLLRSVWIRAKDDPATFPLAAIGIGATVRSLRAMDEKALHKLALAGGSMTDAFFGTFITIVSHFSSLLVRMGGTDAKTALLRQAADQVSDQAAIMVPQCMNASQKHEAAAAPSGAAMTEL